MKRDLEGLLSEIRREKGPASLLVHGDDFRVHEATKAILDLLVPPANRAFNLERFDGRSVPWGEIEAALKTPPLFPGKKVVFVESAPYFLARAHKGELGKRVLELWGEGGKDEAARLFLDLLVLEGWTQERWDDLAVAEVVELFDSEEIDEIGDLLQFCRSQGLELDRRAGSRGPRLLELLEEGLPPWAFLLITSDHVERRSRAYKALEEKGGTLDLTLERDRRGRISPEKLTEYLNRRLRESGKKIEPEARAMILERAGVELWAFHQELEKLLLYIGEEPWVRVRDVEDVFLDRGEGWVFDLTKAVAERDALRALSFLGRLLSQGEPPLKLLGTLASEVRRLLVARHLIEGEMRGRWSGEMSYPEFQRRVLREGSPLVSRSPYGDYMSFRNAERFTAPELLRCLERIHKADRRLKSSGSTPRLVLERLVLEMCRGDR